MTDSAVGRIVLLEIGAVAHGGHCVARIDDRPDGEAQDGGATGRVVFVRHALPGELARVRITEDAGKSYWRGDAVEILRSSPDRVPAPCPYAGPGRCGGCDWQHATPERQRLLKADVVAEQLARLAGVDRAVTVEPLPGGYLGWRTRIQYAVDVGGAVGLRRHRSHAIERIERCLIGAPGVGDAPELAQRWAGASGLDITLGEPTVGKPAVGEAAVGKPGSAESRRAVTLVTAVPTSSRPAVRAGHNRRSGDHRRGPTARAERRELVSGPPTVLHEVQGNRFQVSVDGFWQVHPQAAQALAAAVLAFAAPRAGDSALDLYAGAGLFSALLADHVGVTGSVVGLEADAAAVADAAVNLAPWPWAQVRRGAVTAAAVDQLAAVDLVVLDPPRSGAGREVIAAVLAATRRAVVYVACDPASLARDVGFACNAGWALTGLRAFDLFPMTQHVECVALLEPASAT